MIDGNTERHVESFVSICIGGHQGYFMTPSDWPLQMPNTPARRPPEPGEMLCTVTSIRIVASRLHVDWSESAKSCGAKCRDVRSLSAL